MDWNVKAAVQRLGLDASIANILYSFGREVRLDLAVTRDDGTTAVLKGIHLDHNSARGPALAFLSLQKGLDVDNLRAIAQSATWTAAVVNVPFGGAVGAVECDETAFSRGERERIVRQYVRQLAPLLGPYSNVLAPDRGIDSDAAAWASDEYSRGHGAHSAAILGNACTLGRPIALDGARAIGVCAVLRAWAAENTEEVSHLRVFVQGATGDALARAIGTLGCEVSCCDEQRMFASECDVLVAAGAPCSLNGAGASHVRARVVIEAANVVCTPSADLVLTGRGICVFPDLVAGAGATVAAFIEWDQNLQQVCRTEEQVRHEIERTVSEAFHKVRDRAEREKCSLRSAAYTIAVERVARVERLRQGNANVGG